jgi:hypothetical protein
MATQHLLDGGYRGKLGATVGEYKMGKYYVRTWVKTPNDNTPEQIANKKGFGQSSLYANFAKQYVQDFELFRNETTTGWAMMVGQSRTAVLNNLGVEYIIPFVPTTPHTLDFAVPPVLDTTDLEHPTISATLLDAMPTMMSRAFVYWLTTIGEPQLAYFEAENLSNAAVTWRMITGDISHMPQNPGLAIIVYNPATPSIGPLFSRPYSLQAFVFGPTTVTYIYNAERQSEALVYKEGQMCYMFGDYLYLDTSDPGSDELGLQFWKDDDELVYSLKSSMLPVNTDNRLVFSWPDIPTGQYAVYLQGAGQMPFVGAGGEYRVPGMFTMIPN